MISLHSKRLARGNAAGAAADSTRWPVAAMGVILAITGFYFAVLYVLTR